MIKITFDTNCIINVLDYSSSSSTSVEELFEIMRYALEGDVNLAITTRVETDIEKDKDNKRKEEFIKRLAIFPTIGTICRVDVSKLDSGDIVADERHQKMVLELGQILFPNMDKKDQHYLNKINDIDHLVGHMLGKRDIFVTDDKTIIKKAETLKNSPGIVVMDPKRCLEYINLKANKLVLVQEFYDKLKGYRDFLTKVAGEQQYKKEDQVVYIQEREWLLKKYPLVKDGLMQFKLKMLSVPVGGQIVFDQGDILGIQHLNEKIQELIIGPELEQQIDFFEDDYGYRARYSGDIQSKIKGKFQNILDLLLSYSGYLEKSF